MMSKSPHVVPTGVERRIVPTRILLDRETPKSSDWLARASICAFPSTFFSQPNNGDKGRARSLFLGCFLANGYCF